MEGFLDLRYPAERPEHSQAAHGLSTRNGFGRNGPGARLGVHTAPSIITRKAPHRFPGAA